MKDWNAIREKFLPEPDTSLLPPDMELPVFPRTVSGFMRHSEDPNCDLRDLARTIEIDTNLTCELLKHVNSAAIGRRYKAQSVLQAISSLGIRRSKLFLLTAAVESAFKGLQTHLVDVNDLWLSNLERSLFAKSVAKRFGADEDVAYTGAMLQDFLLPVMANLHLEEYTNFVHERSTAGVDLVHFERARFKCDHATAAAACLLDWHFPDELIVSVLFQHAGLDVLDEYGLQDSAVGAVMASALLPDPFEQSPAGVSQLLEWERRFEEFDLFDIAEFVDQQVEDIAGNIGNRMPLIERIEQDLSRKLLNSKPEEVQREQVVGNYKLVEKLGEGSMGSVYKARHSMLKRPAAVKLMRRERVSPQTIKRFEQEVQLTCQLCHPNTISVYDYGVMPDGTFYYVMEYIDGIDLKDLVTTYGAQPEGRVISLLMQICGSLAEAHGHGIIHRDIKPENVILSNRLNAPDSATVLDFGLVQHQDADEAETKSNGISGTPMYMAPEAIDRPDTVDFRCDLYAVGAVGYFLVTGQNVFTGNSVVDVCLQQLAAAPVTPSKRAGRQIDADLEEILMSCLAKDRDERPESANELMTRLAQCQAIDKWSPQQALQWWEHHDELRKVQGVTSEQKKIDPASETVIFDGYTDDTSPIAHS